MDPFMETKLERESKTSRGREKGRKRDMGKQLLFGAVPLISLAGF